MDWQNQEIIGKLVAKYEMQHLSCLDVGSYDVNGNPRSFFTNYKGLDLVSGPNVDIISRGPYEFGLSDSSFEVVMSCGTLEHVEDFMKLWKEMARVTARYLMLTVPAIGYHEHKYPLDCWRFFPDGVRWMYQQIGFEILDCQLYNAEGFWNTGAVGLKIGE